MFRRLHVGPVCLQALVARTPLSFHDAECFGGALG